MRAQPLFGQTPTCCLTVFLPMQNAPKTDVDVKQHPNITHQRANYKQKSAIHCPLLSQPPLGDAMLCYTLGCVKKLGLPRSEVQQTVGANPPMRTMRTSRRPRCPFLPLNMVKGAHGQTICFAKALGHRTGPHGGVIVGWKMLNYGYVQSFVTRIGLKRLL